MVRVTSFNFSERVRRFRILVHIIGNECGNEDIILGKLYLLSKSRCVLINSTDISILRSNAILIISILSSIAILIIIIKK